MVNIKAKNDVKIKSKTIEPIAFGCVLLFVFNWATSLWALCGIPNENKDFMISPIELYNPNKPIPYAPMVKATTLLIINLEEIEINFININKKVVLINDKLSDFKLTKNITL